MLGSQNTTDVMEAIEFFVTSFEFGVGNAMMGIRRMLVLIWSKEANIKDAVVAAYKRLYLNPQGNNPRYLNTVLILTPGEFGLSSSLRLMLTCLNFLSQSESTCNS